MRQPIRRRRKSKDWMLTYGLTTAFVLGSLWYLDLLPVDEWFKSGAADNQQVANDTSSSETSDDPRAAEEALASIEQWEPEVTTGADFESNSQNHSGPAWPDSSTDSNSGTPASFVSETSPGSEAQPFPIASETGPDQTATETTNRSVSLSEQERIARIFGAAETNPAGEFGTNGNTTTAPGGSTIIPTSAEKPAGFPLSEDSFVQIDQWIADGQYLNAHRELSQRYWKESEALEPLLTRLNKTAGMIYFAPQPHFMAAYEVQQGDLLQSVAPQYKLSWEYLARLNRVRPEKVRVGQKLKVIKGPFAAFVDLSDFSLTIHAHGYFVKRYDIGIGKDNSTPIGSFSVKEKLKNPKYYGSDAVIEADDPSNPLGERWIDIGDSYGIHGTIDPESIRKAESRGCLRLTNEDVIEVYDFLVPGSEVVIRP